LSEFGPTVTEAAGVGIRDITSSLNTLDRAKGTYKINIMEGFIEEGNSGIEEGQCAGEGTGCERCDDTTLERRRGLATV
jgi:predicted PP-loop superfamily ATPase